MWPPVKPPLAPGPRDLPGVLFHWSSPRENLEMAVAPCAQPPLSKLGRGGSCPGPGPTDFLSQCRLWQQPGIGRRWQTAGAERQWGGSSPMELEVGGGGEREAIGKCSGITVTANLLGSGVQAGTCLQETFLSHKRKLRPPTPPPPQHLRDPEEAGRHPPPPQAWGSRGAGGVDVLTSHLLLGDLSGFPPWNVSCG